MPYHAMRGHIYIMACHGMPCIAMRGICHAMPCHAMLRLENKFAMPCDTISLPYVAMRKNAMPCHAMQRYLPCHVMPCHRHASPCTKVAMPCPAMPSPCVAMHKSCHAIPCHAEREIAMPCYATPSFPLKNSEGSHLEFLLRSWILLRLPSTSPSPWKE